MGLVRSEATEQRSLQSRHKRAAWQGADRVTLFRRSRFRSRKARCPQTAFAVCPKRQKAKARHTGRRALRLAQRMGFEPMVPLRGTHDFQSCSFDRSDISAKNLRHYNIEFQEKQAISERTGKIFQDRTILSSCFSVGKEFDEK